MRSTGVFRAGRLLLLPVDIRGGCSGAISGAASGFPGSGAPV